ncbi:response regulator transcription factor [Mycobacterium sp.]|uniref:response regulator n=1 Tax=Mycobacterium sp. TaxID=1785 RepID=UPI002BFA7FC2|nr:response regulator transcription factor [Mycobacterium sp.]HME46732.1 response regulator transcription factor [Mycobacterium sp.]
MTTIILVEGDEVIGRALTGLLDADPDLDVLGQARSAAEAIALIPAATPDVALIEAWLPDGDGIDLCRRLLSVVPGLRCAIFAPSASDEAIADAMLAGASGYLLTDIKGMQLAAAVRDVAAGRCFLDNRATAELIGQRYGPSGQYGQVSGLTGQESQIYELLCRGLTEGRIAARMQLPDNTLKDLVCQLLIKLRMRRPDRAARQPGHHILG